MRCARAGPTRSSPRDETGVVVAVERVEGYERAAENDVMSDAVKASWHKYSSLLPERSHSS